MIMAYWSRMTDRFSAKVCAAPLGLECLFNLLFRGFDPRPFDLAQGLGLPCFAPLGLLSELTAAQA